MVSFNVKLCILIVGACSVYSETFAGISGGNIQVEQLLSTQFSSLYLEYQSLTQWFQTLQGWGMMATFDLQKSHSSALEEDLDDKDFELEESEVKTPSTSSFEMYPFMGAGASMYGAGYGIPPQAPVTPTRRQFEESSENSMMIYLKYLHLITARKLEGAQLVHYQSRYAISMLQGYSTTNPMASSLLYMLYIRDIIQTLMSSQSIQRHDIWTVWNILEIVETIEFPDKSNVPSKLKLSIQKAESTSMRVLLAEAMLDFQTLLMDFYLQPMLAQAAGGPAVAPVNSTFSFLEEESATQSETKPFYGGAGGSFYMQYYMMMFKFYAKYLLMTAAQSLYGASSMDLIHAQNPSQISDSKVLSYLPSMRYSGVTGLQQWCQIKLYLVYWDMYMMMMAPQMPHQSTDGPARFGNANLVQTEEKQIPVTQFEQVPQIQNQFFPEVPQQKAVEPIPQEILQQFQMPEFRQNVVG